MDGSGDSFSPRLSDHLLRVATAGFTGIRSGETSQCSMNKTSSVDDRIKPPIWRWKVISLRALFIDSPTLLYTIRHVLT